MEEPILSWGLFEILYKKNMLLKSMVKGGEGGGGGGGGGVGEPVCQP